MKPQLGFFSFLLFIEIQRNNAVVRIDGNQVLVDSTENDQTKGIFNSAYAIDALTIGNLAKDKVVALVPHLMNGFNANKNHPIGSLFKYYADLCNDYSSLRRLNGDTKNIFKFVTETGGVQGGNTLEGAGTNAISNTDNVFLATKIIKDNENDMIQKFKEFEKQQKQSQEPALARQTSSLDVGSCATVPAAQQQSNGGQQQQQQQSGGGRRRKKKGNGTSWGMHVKF